MNPQRICLCDAASPPPPPSLQVSFTGDCADEQGLRASRRKSMDDRSGKGSRKSLDLSSPSKEHPQDSAQQSGHSYLGNIGKLVDSHSGRLSRQVGGGARGGPEGAQTVWC